VHAATSNDELKQVRYRSQIKLQSLLDATTPVSSSSQPLIPANDTIADRTATNTKPKRCFVMTAKLVVIGLDRKSGVPPDDRFAAMAEVRRAPRLYCPGATSGTPASEGGAPHIIAEQVRPV
jgi:hypothetical protein